MKKNTRRGLSKNPNLKKKYTIKIRQEFLDTEYIDGVYDDDGKELLRPLTENEKAWFDKFNKEWLNASFSNDETDLHQSKEEKLEIYRQNNARNRCLYANKRKTKSLYQINMEKYDRYIANKVPDDLWDEYIIEKVDNKSED
jgi:hypothetical protein